MKCEQRSRLGTRHDWDALMGVLDPEIEWWPSGVFPGLADVYHGREASGGAGTLGPAIGSRFGSSREETVNLTQENVEIVEALLDAFNRGDVNAMFQDAPPGLELDWTRGEGPWSGLYSLDQAKRFVEEFRENWDCTQIDPDEFIEAGEDVVVPVTLHNRGREGIEVRARPSSYSRFATGRSCAFPCIRSARTHSKPWGCGSPIPRPTSKACQAARTKRLAIAPTRSARPAAQRESPRGTVLVVPLRLSGAKGRTPRRTARLLVRPPYRGRLSTTQRVG